MAGDETLDSGHVPLVERFASLQPGHFMILSCVSVERDQVEPGESVVDCLDP